jgi:hypothetical protein
MGGNRFSIRFPAQEHDSGTAKGILCWRALCEVSLKGTLWSGVFTPHLVVFIEANGASFRQRPWSLN